MGEKPSSKRQVRRRWRDYSTATGNRPVRDFLLSLSDTDVAAIAAAMEDVRHSGLEVARHVRADIYEVRAPSGDRTFRILFAPEGRMGQVLLALEGFAKKTRRTPDRAIDLAQQRLRDWRSRGERTRKKRP